MAHDVQAEQTVGTARFGDRVAEAVERKRSQLVVGLDPRPDLFRSSFAATRTSGGSPAPCGGGGGGPPPPPAARPVTPPLGRDAAEPSLAACRRDGGGIFCVLKPSKAGSAEIQDLVLSDGRPLWHEVARLVREWGEDIVGDHGLSSVGAVVGATHPRAVGEGRRAPPPWIPP